MINIPGVMTITNITTDIETTPGINVPGDPELFPQPAPLLVAAGTEALLGSVARLSEVLQDEIVWLLQLPLQLILGELWWCGRLLHHSLDSLRPLSEGGDDGPQSGVDLTQISQLCHGGVRTVEREEREGGRLTMRAMS